jgi:hypothetical protein
MPSLSDISRSHKSRGSESVIIRFFTIAVVYLMSMWSSRCFSAIVPLMTLVELKALLERAISSPTEAEREIYAIEVVTALHGNFMISKTLADGTEISAKMKRRICGLGDMVQGGTDHERKLAAVRCVSMIREKGVMISERPERKRRAPPETPPATSSPPDVYDQAERSHPYNADRPGPRQAAPGAPYGADGGPGAPSPNLGHPANIQGPSRPIQAEPPVPFDIDSDWPCFVTSWPTGPFAEVYLPEIFIPGTGWTVPQVFLYVEPEPPKKDMDIGPELHVEQSTAYVRIEPVCKAAPTVMATVLNGRVVR